MIGKLWVMLLPAIIYIFIFCYVPMYGVQLAFREYDFKAGYFTVESGLALNILNSFLIVAMFGNNTCATSNL